MAEWQYIDQEVAVSNPRRLPALDSILEDLAARFARCAGTPGYYPRRPDRRARYRRERHGIQSVVDTLLLRPPPFHEPERLVWIANHDTSGLSGQTTQVS